MEIFRDTHGRCHVIGTTFSVKRENRSMTHANISLTYWNFQYGDGRHSNAQHICSHVHFPAIFRCRSMATNSKFIVLK